MLTSMRFSNTNKRWRLPQLTTSPRGTSTMPFLWCNSFGVRHELSQHGSNPTTTSAGTVGQSL
ncbi:hypothetical protein M758_UG046800 [Ceratodon purpureus]|nr:hypothetical protein M758_UG046800 [Ceratodon purpureus]